MKKRRSPVDTDSDEEDFPREPARKFFRPHANATTPAADHTYSNSNANATTPEISYARRSSKRPATTPTITITDEKPDQSRSKATKDKVQKDLDADVAGSDEDLRKIGEFLERPPSCLPPTPPSPMSSPSHVVSRAITTIKTNNTTVDTNKRRQLILNDLNNYSDKKNYVGDLEHECLTGQLALLIDSHNRFIDTIRHLFSAIVNQPNTICKSCSSKLDMTAKDD